MVNMNGNLIKYNDVFRQVLSLSDNSELESLQYRISEGWNSIAQIGIISTLEDSFDINMDTEDIFGLTSYETGLKILKDKYDISFD